MQVEYEIVKKLFRKKTIDKYIKKSIYLSDYNKDHVINFLLIRLFLSIIIFFFSFILFDESLFISLLIMISFITCYTYFKYDYKIKIREKELEKDASLFFEVLVLSLKSGKNLLDAIKLTTSTIDNSFAKEFRSTIDETKYGKSLIEAINDFKDKMSSENIKNIIISIVEAYTLGKDMVESIEKELELLDEKRISEIKTYINKLPIKISIISVILLIPLMLLIILSPVLLEYFG